MRAREVFFIHGAGGGGWEWDRWVPVFRAAGWKTAAPDLLPAPAGLAATRFEHYLEQVVAWLPSGRDHRCVLVGASMGGLLALKAAERAPLAALVLVNSVPPAGTPGWPVREQEYPEIIRWSGSALERTRRGLPDADDATARWVHSHWRDESGAVMRVLSQGVEATCPRMPSLVLAGWEDAEVPAPVSLALGRRLGADAMAFAGVSHVGALIGRRAAAIAAAACAWLQAALSPRPVPPG